MTHVENEQEIARKEAENIVKNYTRTENMLIDGYPDLLPQEKWLCICLKRLCGAEKTRFLSLRYIAKKTGFSVGSLAACKKTGKPGMIRRLHDAGLIHAEIKKRVGANGTTSGNEQYHITITDIWQLNYDFYYGSTCSESEHLDGESESPVQNMNATCSEYERNLFRNCNNSKITTNNITTSNKDTYDADASRTLADFSLEEIATYLAAHTNQPELSTPIVDKSPEQVATSNPIASDDPQPTQDENGSHKQPPQGRAQPEKKPRAPRVQKPEKVVLTPQGQAFYTLYCSMPWVKIPPEITEKGREQCEKLGTTLTTQEQMFQLRNYMGKKAFFKGKGFSFALMIMAVNDMASEQPNMSPVQAQLQAAAPGFEVKSQVDLMRMMPEERRDYAKRLNAHLAANRTEKEKQALEYALKLEIV